MSALIKLRKDKLIENRSKQEEKKEALLKVKNKGNIKKPTKFT
tara:strand:+ start:383 stop:511 length:129 start_codon:yes stop_codon:yes gene_type:complete